MLKKKIEQLIPRVLSHFINKVAMVIPFWIISYIIYSKIFEVLELEIVGGLDALFGPILALLAFWWIGYNIVSYSIFKSTLVFYGVMLLTILLLDISYSLLFKRDPGKQCMELRIYNDKGGKPNSIQIIVRSMVKYLSLVFAPYLLLIVLLNKKARGLHDYIARTYVN